jgi:hypothetical protein
LFFTQPSPRPAGSLYEEPDTSQPGASVSEAFGTSFEEATRTQSIGQTWLNVNDAYDSHNAKVREITGESLWNPARANIDHTQAARFYPEWEKYKAEGGQLGHSDFKTQWLDGEYKKRLEELAEKHPDRRGDLIPEVGFRSQGRSLAVAASEAAEKLSQDNSPAAWLGWLGGQGAAMAVDPWNVLTMPVGFSGKAGVGVKGLLEGAGKAAGANAAIEAGMQVPIQSERGGQGLSSGFGEGAANVVGAGVFGGVADPLVRGTARTGRWYFGFEPKLDAEGKVVAYTRKTADGKEVTIRPEVKDAAEAGDPRAVREVIEKGEGNLDRFQRAELDAADADSLLRQKPDNRIDDLDHDVAAAQAIRHAADPEIEPVAVVRAEASLARLRDMEGDLAELRAEREALAARERAVDETPARTEGETKALKDAEAAKGETAKVRAELEDRIVQLEGARDAERAGTMSPELIALEESGRYHPAYVDAVRTYVADKAVQARVLEDLQKRAPASADEIRHAVADILQSPDYRKPVADVGPEPVGVVNRRLDDPYGKEAQAQVAALEAKLAEELAGGKPQPPRAREMTPDPIERQANVVKAVDEAVAETAAEMTPAYRDPESGAPMSEGDVATLVEIWRYVREEKPKKPEGLTGFIMRTGRLKDQDGEITRILGGQNRQLISGKGSTLDDAALRAYEAGFFPERPSIAEFLDAIDRDARGDLVVKLQDMAALEDWRVAQDMEVELDRLGIGKARSEDDIRGHFQGARTAGAGESRGRADTGRARGEDELNVPPFRFGEAPAVGRAVAEARRMLPENVAVRAFSSPDELGPVRGAEVAGAQERTGQRVSGFYDPDASAVWLSIAATDPRGIAIHEAAHALEMLGLLTKQEMDLLVMRAEKIDDLFPGGRDLYRENYRELVKAGRMTEEQFTAYMRSEEMAHLIEARAIGRDFGREVNGILDRILVFFERLRNKLSGYGFQTVDDVIEAILSGEVAKRQAVRQVMAQEDITAFAIRAYHGSPHDFDRFDLSKIGSGEGAQAYGHGAYFAESEAVAKQYRKNLSTQAEESPENVAAQWLKQANGDKDRALAIAKEARLARPDDDVLMFAEDAIATGAPLPEPTHPAGRMYEVNIKADLSEFLDFDQPLQAQGERVKQAVEPALKQIAAEMGQGASAEKLAQLDAMGLGNIAARLQPKTIDPWSIDTGTVAREYSHLLREAGIPGIRYKDQGSRGAEGGTFNYVVFDDSLIEIVAKDGKPVSPQDKADVLRSVNADFDPAQASSANLMFAFAGERAKTADLEKLAKAKGMAAAGKTREAIWDETGWFQGVDGKWRFEIDDSDASVTGGKGRLGDILNHPDLLKAYPDLANIRTSPTPKGADYAGAHFQPKGLFDRLTMAGEQIQFRDIESLLHEMQHGLQRREAFAVGGDPKQFNILAASQQNDAEVLAAFVRRAGDDFEQGLAKFQEVLKREPSQAVKSTVRLYSRDDIHWNANPNEGYRRLAGEVEARAVDKRAGMTPEERQDRPPWLDYDVAEKDQIVRFANGEGVSQLSYSAEPPVSGLPAMRGTIMFAIRAYHGSPHDFDRFDLSRIGTGEGAQAYGHGLYFAEKEAIARSYRDKLTDAGTELHLNGKRFDELPEPMQNAVLSYDTGRAPEQHLALLQKRAAADPMFGEELAAYRQLVDGVKAGSMQVERKPLGRMYEVNIKADPQSFLDYDVPISQQPAARAAVEQAGFMPYTVVDQAGKRLDLSRGMSKADAEAYAAAKGGRAIPKDDFDFDALQKAYRGKDAEISKALAEAGIPGVKYKDAGSRDGAGGTYNYVVFSDNLIEIVAKDGKPVSPQDKADVISGMTGKPSQDQGPMFAMRSDLDMSPEARKQRAEQMGFDTRYVWYHGTNKDFEAFDPSQSGVNTLTQDEVPAIWAVNRPEIADGYAAGWGGETRDGANIRPLYARLKDMDIWDLGGGQLTADVRNQALTEAKEAGRSGVVFTRAVDLARNVAPGGAASRNAPHIIAVFDPAALRSTNAAFDPAQSSSSNLMFAMRDGGAPDAEATVARLMEAAEPLRQALRQAGKGPDAPALDFTREGGIISQLTEASPGPMRFIRDEDGLITGVETGGMTYAVARDDAGRITGMLTEAQRTAAQQQEAVTGTIADLIARNTGLAPEKARSVADEGVAIVRDNLTDPDAIRTGLAGLVQKTIDEVQNPASALMFAMRDERGRMKPGADMRVQALQADLADIEAKLQTAMWTEVEALQAKRGALISALALERGIDDITNYRDPRGRIDPAKAFMNLFESSGAGTGLDLKHLHQTIENKYREKLWRMLWDARRGALTGDKRRNQGSIATLMDDTIREAAGENTRNPIAKQFAQDWLAVAEEIRQEFNAEGGAIAKLDGWYGPQYHDPEALLKAGSPAWVDTVFEALDRDRMIDFKTGKPMGDAELRSMLRDTWRKITSAGQSILDDPTGRPDGLGAVYKRHQEHRVLHFKNADAYLAYNKVYGGGDVYAGMLGHIAVMTREIAMMRRFGANPDLTVRRLTEFVKSATGPTRTLPYLLQGVSDTVADFTRLVPGAEKVAATFAELDKAVRDLDKLYAGDRDRISKRHTEAISAGETRVWELARSIDNEITDRTRNAQDNIVAEKVRSALDELTALPGYAVDRTRKWMTSDDYLIGRAVDIYDLFKGTTNIPAGKRFANASAAARSWVGASTLAFAPFSSIADHANQLAARKFIGMPATGQLQTWLKSFGPGDRQAAMQAGFVFDNALAAYAEKANGLNDTHARSFSAYLADRTHALSFLSPMTTAQKVAFSQEFAAWMVTLGQTPMNRLDDRVQRMFARHNITANDWDLIRSSPPDTRFHGIPMLTREAISTAVGEDLAEKYMMMLLRERGHAVLEGTLQGRSFWLWRTRPGTAPGEFMRSVAMLKSFPTTYALMVLGRVYDETMTGRGLTMSTAGYGTAVFVVGTMLGALAMQMKSIGKGKDPEDMSSPKFWARAFLQSGGIGIAGDFIAASENRFGGGAGATFIGPVFSNLVDPAAGLLFGNALQLARGEKTNAGREMVTALRKITPVLPWYLRQGYERVVLDWLQQKTDPEAYRSFRSQEQKAKKDRNQNFYWPPGQSAPSRGPNFGAAIGRQ